MAEALAKLKDGFLKNCNTGDTDGSLLTALIEALTAGAQLNVGQKGRTTHTPTNYSLGGGGFQIVDDHLDGIDTALGGLASSPHGLGGSDHSSATLTQLNALVSNATLDDQGSSRTPLAHASSHSENQSDEVLAEALGSAEMTTGKLLAPDGSGGVGWVDAPAAPTNSSLTEVGDTVEVEFDKVAANGDVDWYEVWSSVGGTTDYNLIGIVSEADAGTPTKVVDATYAKKTTIYYKIYAVRHGVYSSALSDSIALANNASDVTGLTTVAQLDSFLLTYVLPTERKFAYVQIKRHAHAVQGSLSEGSATQVYAGIANHFVYTIPDADLTKWHQFWIYTVTAT